MLTALELWRIDGLERHGGNTLSLLCATSVQNRRYWTRLAFDVVCGSTYCGHCSAVELADLEPHAVPGCALLVVEGEHFGTAQRLAPTDFKIPCWLMTSVSIPCGEQVLANPGVKSDLRRIRRAGMTYRVTNDASALRRFHEAMYVPYVTSRYGDGAFVVPYEQVEAQRWALLQVLVDAQVIGGTVIVFDSAGPRLWLAGVLGADARAVGVIGATNFFAFEYLAQLGYSSARLGYSRPFLRDGVLRYKSKWGHSVAGTSAQSFLLRLLSPTPGAAQFLFHNPFIDEEGGSLHPVVFVKSDTPAPIDDAWPSGLGSRRIRLLGPELAGISTHAAEQSPAADAEYWNAVLQPRLDTVGVAREVSFARHAITASLRGVTRHVVGSHLSRDLVAVSHATACTPFVTCLAAFVVLTARLANTIDVVVATASFDGAVGDGAPLGRAGIVRVDLSGDPTFVQVIERVRRRWVGAARHAAVGISRLIDLIAPEGARARGSGIAGFDWRDSNLAHEGTPEGRRLSAACDMHIAVDATSEKLEIHATYDRNRFSDERAAELVRQYERILSQVVDDPEIPLDQFTLLTSTSLAMKGALERPIRFEWAGSVGEGFREHAARRPDSIAVVEANEHWTYEALDEASDRLAQHLMARRVEPGDVVAILAARRAPITWTLLAIMKAGAAFVILDASHPIKRLKQYVALAGASVIVDLCDRAVMKAAQIVNAPSTTVRWSMHISDPVDRPTERGRRELRRRARAIAPESRAYVAFTSGSSGTPKAVVGAHASLTRFARWYATTFDLGAADRFSMLSGLGHDPLHRDVFLALTLGACVCVPCDGGARDPGRVVGWLTDSSVSVVNATPGMLSLLLADPAGTRPSSVRLLLVVGGVLSLDTASASLERFPQATCVNLYGTTETQQALAHFVVPRDVAATGDRSGASVPIGRGIDDVQIVVLRSDDRLAGIGECGEICVRSPYIASGYLGDPAATAARFRSNPFTSVPADRVYHTGDIGRYRMDGDVEFVRRIDRQVKILDHRVELGEIEATLEAHPLVRTAAVFVSDRTCAEIRACVVPPPGAEPGEPELRAHLAQRLPSYMLPARILVIDDMPLTPNRKIDYAAVAEIDSRRDAAADGAVDTSEALRAIWQAVLGADVGPDDDFFALGGHSLAAMEIVFRVRSGLGVDVPLEAVFSAPTPSRMARIVNQCRVCAASN